jgi:hypothetical protein
MVADFCKFRSRLPPHKESKDMAENNGWHGFVNVDLTAADKKAIKAKKLSIEELFAWLAVEVAAGYRFGFGHDADRECYIATLTAKGLDNINAGYSMSQRHSNAETAIKALWYAHEIKMERNWAGAPKQEQLQFNW